MLSLLLLALGAPVTLPVSQSEILHVPHLKRAAVADSKIASVRAVPPDRLLVTAKKPGRTTVRGFAEGDREYEFVITVVAADLDPPSSREVVRVALEFLELDGALSRQVGFRWPEAIQFGSAGSIGSATSGLNYATSFSSARGWIQHLVREGWAKILANPELYVRLGEEAIFHSGGEFPVSTSSENYGRYHKHVEWKPYGLHVKVRPRSGDRFNISSDIQIDVSEVNPSQAIEGIPALSRRQLHTKMQSRDGETVILSGLVRQAAGQTKEGVPFLSDIPFLGALFSAKQEHREDTEIFMAVTFSLTSRARERERLDATRTRIHEAAPP